MAAMKIKWPSLGWTHAGIAFLSALIACAYVSNWVNNPHSARYARSIHYDGSDGLGMRALSRVHILSRFHTEVVWER